MNCNKCGREIADHAAYCMHCGATVQKEQENISYQGYQEYSSNQHTPRQTSGLALASLISSIVGFLFCPFIGHIAGLILGFMAKNDISQSAGTKDGGGMATAGIIISAIGLGLAILVALVAVIFMSY